jgi:hypothetical protein
MHPGVGYPLERIVPAEGAEICGYNVPGGTVVGMNAAVVHRDKHVFGADADTFRPERWTEEGASGDLKHMDRALLTVGDEIPLPDSSIDMVSQFGAGARTCIGKNISIMEMGKFVPQILRHFDIYWDSDSPEWKISTYWFSKQSGFCVKFKPRDKTVRVG